jgi:hypothetical protein
LELLKFDGGFFSNDLSETEISLAFLIPHFDFGPLVDLSEQLQKEDTQVVALNHSAAMDRWHYASKDEGENLQEVEVGHSVNLQHLQEVEGVEGITGWEDQPWINAVLNEHIAEVQSHVLVSHVLETTYHLFLQELLQQGSVFLALFVLHLQFFLMFLEFILVSPVALSLLAFDLIYLLLYILDLLLVDLVRHHQLLEINVPEDGV